MISLFDRSTDAFYFYHREPVVYGVTHKISIAALTEDRSNAGSFDGHAGLVMIVAIANVFAADDKVAFLNFTREIGIQIHHAILTQFFVGSWQTFLLQLSADFIGKNLPIHVQDALKNPRVTAQ